MSHPDGTEIAKSKLVAYLAVLTHNMRVAGDTCDPDDVILQISPTLPSRLLPVEITLRDIDMLTK